MATHVTRPTVSLPEATRQVEYKTFVAQAEKKQQQQRLLTA